FLFGPLQQYCNLGNFKAVKTPSQRFATALTSRKTAGLITLRASRVNAAVFLDAYACGLLADFCKSNHESRFAPQMKIERETVIRRHSESIFIRAALACRDSSI